MYARLRPFAMVEVDTTLRIMDRLLRCGKRSYVVADAIEQRRPAFACGNPVDRLGEPGCGVQVVPRFAKNGRAMRMPGRRLHDAVSPVTRGTEDSFEGRG